MELTKEMSTRFALLVTRKRGLAVIAIVCVFGIVLLAMAQSRPIGLGPSLSTTRHLHPVPTDVFEHATGLHVQAPQTFSHACSLPSPRPLALRLQGLAKARCPLPVTEVVPYGAQRKILGANLVRLMAPSISVSSPKQVAYPPVAWIVFFSGREAVGDYFTTIYDAYSGAPVLNVVLVWVGT